MLIFLLASGLTLAVKGKARQVGVGMERRAEMACEGKHGVEFHSVGSDSKERIMSETKLYLFFKGKAVLCYNISNFHFHLLISSARIMSQIIQNKLFQN